MLEDQNQPDEVVQATEAIKLKPNLPPKVSNPKSENAKHQNKSQK